MAIECKACSRKFRLDENLLKPTGSRVRCSKCGTIFQAYPDPIGRVQNSPLERADMAEGAIQAELAACFSEKREHPRVLVSIPVLCDAPDFEASPHDLHLGGIRDVSRGGLAIELFSSPVSEQVALFFIDVENREVQIKARMVHSRTEGLFKTRVGLSFEGLPIEIGHFITQVMKTHYSSYTADPQIRI
jgi:predicted Zn finger-like uncharacterized protein